MDSHDFYNLPPPYLPGPKEYIPMKALLFEKQNIENNIRNLEDKLTDSILFEKREICC